MEEISAVFSSALRESERIANRYTELAALSQSIEVRGALNRSKDDVHAWRWLVSHFPEIVRDSQRLDALSEPGTVVRVSMMATENMANPPITRYAEVTLAAGCGSSTSGRFSLREAIDASMPAASRHSTEDTR